jgi:hypothetical protein
LRSLSLWLSGRGGPRRGLDSSRCCPGHRSIRWRRCWEDCGNGGGEAESRRYAERDARTRAVDA